LEEEEGVSPEVKQLLDRGDRSSGVVIAEKNHTAPHSHTHAGRRIK